MEVMITARQPQAVSLSSMTTMSASSTQSVTSTVSSTSMTTSAMSTSESSSPTHDNLPGRPTNITDTATTSASSSPTGSPDSTNRTLTTIYPTFFAIFIFFGALAGFLIWHRRRRYARRGRAHRRGPRGPVSTIVAAPQVISGGRSQAWLGRWRSAEVSREEGLNEEGEAPPPYMPKSDEEPGRMENDATRPAVSHDDTPAIPLQTLSREDAGFKPPDYEPHVVEVSSEHESSSRPNAAQGSSTNPT